MTDCSISGESFVHFVFSPTIAVLTTQDVELFLSPTNLTFTELLLPFSSQLKDVLMKDGNNITHLVKKLNVRFHNVSTPFNPFCDRHYVFQPTLFSSRTSQFHLNGETFDIPVLTPWYESCRHIFISNLGCHEQEFLTRYIGCLFVVSTRNPDPLRAFACLVQQQAQLAKTQPHRWFHPTNIVKFFVLINDPILMSPVDSGKVFQAISAAYGNVNCYFLDFAISQNSSPSDVGDMWIRHLLPHGWTLNECEGNKSGLNPHLIQPHGKCLCQRDHDKIRSFVNDFVTRILVPWTESTIKTLNDQAAHRLRKSRGFLSVTRRLFSQNASSETASLSSSQSDSNVNLLDGDSSGASTTSVYPDDAPEQQMRRLADLLFLFQQYESAHQIYDVLKRDFKQKAAWVHYAGTQEMSAMSTYLQGTVSQRQYPHHQMDDAIITYVTKCKNHDLALRAVLLHTEALKSRDLFAEMAMCFIRFADVNGVMTEGLLLEQAAYCSLRGKRPHLRQFAMRMALAGVHFARAKQPYLSVHSFSLAHEIISSKNPTRSSWTLALDYINENLARQLLLLEQPKEALTSLWHTLSPFSIQLEAAQGRFLREFLNILNKVNASGEKSVEWPELSLPLCDKNRVKVMLGAPTRKTDDDSPVEARGTDFSDDEHDDAEDARIFAAHRSSLPRNFAAQVLPSLVSSDDIPAWMLATDDSSIETWRPDDANGIKRPGEDLIRLLYGRPSYPLPRQAVFRRLKALLSLWVNRKLPTDACGCNLVVMTHPLKRDREADKRPRWRDVPLGEQLTVQIPLYNSWKIPLVLTDVHLLWQASFISDSSTEAGLVFSNEDVNLERLREARNFVHTSVINEFYMLPGDKKVIELRLQPRRCLADLQIIGVAFKLDVSSSRQTFVSDVPSPTTPPSSQPFTSSLELLSITPQLDVSIAVAEDLRDPLNSTNHSTNISISGSITSTVQGKVRFPSAATDFRFHWNAGPTKPLLKVYFEGFPQCLFEGEICKQRLTFVNAGNKALGSLHVVTSWPSFFILCNTLPSVVTSLPIATPLEASHSLTETFWIRAPRAQKRVNHLQLDNGPMISQTLTSPARRISMVFGYTSDSEPLELRYLQHEARVQILPSLKFTATCARTQGSKVDSLIVTLRCKNISNQHSFNLVQLVCFDPNWSIELLAPTVGTNSKDGVLVCSNQEVTFCIRAKRRKPILIEDDGAATSSSIILRPEWQGIDAFATPHAQFFQLSSKAAQLATRENAKVAAPETDLQPKNFYLLAFWRLICQTDSAVDSERLGQSHIRVVYAHAPKALQSPPGSDLTQMLASIPSLLPLSSLLRLRLHHPSKVTHSFDRGEEFSPFTLISTTQSSAMATIPVTAEIYNASSSPLTARISTNEDNGKSSRSLLENASRRLPRVLWTGACVQQFSLDAGQIHRLDLSARVASPGVYEVNSFCLKASTSNPSSSPLRPSSHRYSNSSVDGNDGDVVIGVSNTSAPFIRQLCEFSSLVVVMAAESS